MTIEHAHAAQNGQIPVTDDVRALQREQHQHLGRPYANAPELRQRVTQCLVVQLGQRMQIGAALDDAARDVLNVARLAKGDANALQLVQRT